MKKTELSIIQTFHSPVVEKMLLDADTELEMLAIKRAKHFANKGQPLLVGDKLSNYTSEIKTRCEKLAADIFKFLLAGTHVSDGSLLVKEYREKENEHLKLIEEKENQIGSNEYELGNEDPWKTKRNRRNAFLILAILFISEVLLNAKAMQINGDNLLVASIMALGVSLSVVLLAHYSTHYYKSTNDRVKKIRALIGTLAAAIVLFAALAYMRSAYLEANGIQVNPIFLMVINLVIFIVACLVSYFMFPDKNELKRNEHLLKLANQIKNLKAEVQVLKDQLVAWKTELNKRLKEKIGIIMYLKHIRQSIIKMFYHKTAVLKDNNLIHRKGVPDCFNDVIPEPDIADNSTDTLNLPNDQLS